MICQSAAKRHEHNTCKTALTTTGIVSLRTVVLGITLREIVLQTSTVFNQLLKIIQ